VAEKKDSLPEGLTDAAADGTAPAAPNKRKRLILIGAAAALALGGGGGAYVMLSGGGSKPHAEEAAAAEPAEGGEGGEGGAEANFVDVPPMTVNLRTADGVQRYLKIHLMLVPGKVTGDAITKKLPLVLDTYQPFLRELRPEDLSGAAATFRIKEEMLIRANAALGAGAVRDVLIQDLLQQ
jgi:flagellar FliL protein